MERELQTIFETQKLDTLIIEKERKRSNTPRRLALLDEEIEGLKNRKEQEKNIVDELEKERRKKEKELEVEKEKVKKFESRLFEVKTNKEYQALLKEIETAKEANDKIEEEILILMDKIEELKNDHEALSAELKKREGEIAKEKADLMQEMESIDKDISELTQQKENLLSIVNDTLRKTYTMLLEKRGGIAVVNVKNGVCCGCHMNIPPQLFIEVTKNNRLNLCPSCSRIFYFIEE